MSSKVLHDLSSFMSKELAEGFLTHIRKRNILDKTVCTYANTVLRVLKLIHEKTPMEITDKNIADLKSLDDLGFQHLRNHHRHAW